MFSTVTRSTATIRIISAAILPLLMSAEALATDSVVVVTATAGFRHESIPTAEAVLTQLSHSMGFDAAFARDETQMREMLSPTALQNVKLVIFANTTGELPFDGRDDLLAWLANGGSFIGVHSASDTWHEWPQYIAMLGAEFDHHPDQTTRMLFGENEAQQLFEEFYLFKNFNEAGTRILLSLHESPEPSRDAGFFPIAWTRSYGNGRVFYTALGHRSDVWTNGWFQQHLANAIAWALHRDVVPRRRAAH